MYRMILRGRSYVDLYVIFCSQTVIVAILLYTFFYRMIYKCNLVLLRSFVHHRIHFVDSQILCPIQILLSLGLNESHETLPLYSKVSQDVTNIKLFGFVVKHILAVLFSSD